MSTATAASSSSPNFPLFGVSLAYLEKHSEKNPAWTTADFCEHHVKQVTLQSKTSLAEHLVAAQPELVKPVAEVFVSHAWQYNFAKLVAALKQTQDRFVWLDVVCVNQHRTARDFPEQWWYETFASALRAIGRAEIVLAPWNDPLPSRRSWCIYEIQECVKQSLETHIRMFPEEEVSFKAAMKKGETGQAFYRNMFTNIDVMNGRAFFENDEKVIRSLVQKAGPKQVNDLVLKPIKAWLVQVSDRAWEESSLPLERSGVAYSKAYLHKVLGELDMAEEWFNRAISLARDSQTRIGLELSLADALRAMGASRQNDAMETYSRALAQAQEANDLASEAHALHGQGCIEMSRGNLAQAEPLLQKCLAIRKSQGQENADLAQIHGSLGRLFTDMNRLEEARPLLIQSLAMRQKILGDAHVDSAQALLNLSDLAIKENNMEWAKSLRKQALEIRERALGEVCFLFDNGESFQLTPLLLFYLTISCTL